MTDSDEDLITVESYPTEMEAELDRQRLGDAGIASLVSADDVGGMHLEFTITKGVQLQVRRADLKRARRELGIKEEGK